MLYQDANDSPPKHQLKCLIEGNSEFVLTKKTKTETETKTEDDKKEIKMSSTDCIFVPSKWNVENLKGGHWITIR